MDYSKPIFLILPAILSLFVCDLFFFELPVFVIFNLMFSLLFFALVVFVLSGVVGPGDRIRKENILSALPEYSVLRNCILFLVFISYIPSFILVYLFSSKFGFASIFNNSSLLQDHAISNSLGNFLYLNVLLLPLLLILSRHYKGYLLLVFMSFFFLFFTGIKSYLIQSVMLCFLFYLFDKRIGQVFIYLSIFCIFIVSFFYFYDSRIDLAANNIEESLGRFLAYFSGSWATFHYYSVDGVDFEYPFLSMFYPVYKVFSFGGISLNDYAKFYSVNGYELNVTPVFQWVYLEGGGLCSCSV